MKFDRNGWKYFSILMSNELYDMHDYKKSLSYDDLFCLIAEYNYINTVIVRNSI